jgi:hypothetical protein
MRPNKTNHTERLDAASDELAGKISGAIQKLQRAFARRTNKIFGNMPSTRFKATVIVFLLLCGGYSLYLVAAAITKHPQSSLKIEAIQRPKSIEQTGSETTEGNNYVSEALFNKLQAFKRYMDSLKTKNLQAHDSILYERPMLMDSVRLLEGLYYSQKQNEEHEK